METVLNISLSVVEDLKIRTRGGDEILGVCPVCHCRDANFNVGKLVWRCFSGDSLVLTSDGYKQIKDVSVGDIVLTSGGKFNEVVKTHSNNVAEKTTVKSKQLTQDMISTPDHIYYVFNNDEFVEKCAKDLVCGDLLVYPIINEFVDCKNLVVESQSINKYLSRLVNSYNIEVTDDFLKMAGLYIAEGSASYGQISFSFGSKEIEYIEFIESYFLSLGFKPRKRTGKHNCTKVTVCNVWLSCLLGDLFGRGSENKHIPSQLMRLPPKKARILLQSILDGDGYVTKSKCWSNRLGQTSKILCLQVKQIASYCGYNCSGYLAKDYYKNTKKPTYINWLSDYNKGIYSLRDGWFSLIKVDGVVCESVEDVFYDLSVKNNHTYTVNGCLVHNCWHGNHSGRIIPEDGYEVRQVEEKKLDVYSIRSLYSKLAEKYHSSLFSDVISYLLNRGLTEDTIGKFRIGFCGTDFYDEYSDSVAEDSGIIYNNYPLLSNRVVIPYLHNDGVVNLRGRVVDFLKYKKNTPTYVSLSGSNEARGANFLFNHDIIEKEPTIIITEGEFKALVAIQYGFPVVSTPGIFGWNKKWSPLFKNKEVILAADNDKISGLRSPAYLMAKSLSKEIPHLKVAVLYKTSKQEKVDIDSMILESGVKSFENSIKGAMDLNKWLWLQERKGYGK